MQQSVYQRHQPLCVNKAEKVPARTFCTDSRWNPLKRKMLQIDWDSDWAPSQTCGKIHSKIGKVFVSRTLMAYKPPEKESCHCMNTAREQWSVKREIHQHIINLVKWLWTQQSQHSQSSTTYCKDLLKQNDHIRKQTDWKSNALKTMIDQAEYFRNKLLSGLKFYGMFLSQTPIGGRHFVMWLHSHKV